MQAPKLLTLAKHYGRTLSTPLLGRQAVLLGLLLSSRAWGASAADDEAYVRFAVATNRISPLESAVSHSPDRYHIAGGVKVAETAFLPAADASPYAASKAVQKSAAGQPIAFNLPQVWLSRGVTYPFDAGVSYGVIDGTRVSQLAAYGQWTGYEAFARPALALRTSLGKTFGLSRAEVTTWGVQGLTSWGYRFVTVYAGLGGTYSRLQLRPGEGETKASPRHIFETSRLAGLHLQLIPGLLSTVIDVQLAGASQRTIAAKLALEL